MSREESVSGSFGALTRRQWEVARLMAVGLSRAEIAERLAISAHTAHEHEKEVLSRCGCKRRGQVAALVFREGFDSPSN